MSEQQLLTRLALSWDLPGLACPASAGELTSTEGCVWCAARLGAVCASALGAGRSAGATPHAQSLVDPIPASSRHRTLHWRNTTRRDFGSASSTCRWWTPEIGRSEDRRRSPPEGPERRLPGGSELHSVADDVDDTPQRAPELVRRRRDQRAGSRPFHAARRSMAGASSGVGTASAKGMATSSRPIAVEISS